MMVSCLNFPRFYLYTALSMISSIKYYIALSNDNIKSIFTIISISMYPGLPYMNLNLNFGAPLDFPSPC